MGLISGMLCGSMVHSENIKSSSVEGDTNNDSFYGNNANAEKQVHEQWKFNAVKKVYKYASSMEG